MIETSTCTSLDCEAVTFGTVAKCPACGARVNSSRPLRRLGWVLLATGILLTGMMGYLVTTLAPSLTHPGQAMAGGSRFTGTAEQGALALKLFWTVVVFGLFAMVNGC